MASISFNGKTIGVADLACNTVKPAVADNSGLTSYQGVSCSSDPVVNGTTITLMNAYASPPFVYASITSVATTSSSATDAAFDYTYASGLWSLAFTSVVGLYLLSKNVGLILSLIRGH